MMMMMINQNLQHKKKNILLRTINLRLIKFLSMTMIENAIQNINIYSSVISLIFMSTWDKLNSTIFLVKNSKKRLLSIYSNN